MDPAMLKALIRFSCVPALRKQLMVATTVYFYKRYEVIQIMVNCHFDLYFRLWVNVDFKFTNPQLMCSVILLEKLQSEHLV